MLAARCIEQQAFCVRVPGAVGLWKAEQRLTNLFSSGGSTWLAGLYDLMPMASQPCGKQPGLGAFPSALPAFETDEASPGQGLSPRAANKRT